jgi:hypothetical protein
LRWVTRCGVRWPCSAPIWADTSTSINAWARVRTPSRRKSTSALSALRSNSYSSILDTTTVLLLDVDPQSLRFEDDAVVFSSPPAWCTQRGGAPDACTATCFSCCGPGSTPLPGTLFVLVGAARSLDGWTRRTESGQDGTPAARRGRTTLTPARGAAGSGNERAAVRLWRHLATAAVAWGVTARGRPAYLGARSMLRRHDG